MQLHPYLNFGGNCEQAFRYYEKHLGGKLLEAIKYEQNPDAAKAHPGQGDKILHARLEVAGTHVMGTDVPADKFQPVRSSYLSLAVDSSPEAERIHKALAEGGEVFTPMQETFFAHRFSVLRDKFGVLWMLSHLKPMPN
jgi:PhnB protein